GQLFWDHFQCDQLHRLETIRAIGARASSCDARMNSSLWGSLLIFLLKRATEDCTGYLGHPFKKRPKIVFTGPVLSNLLTSQVMIWFLYACSLPDFCKK